MDAGRARSVLGRRQFVQGVGVAGLGLLAGCGRLPWQAEQPAQVRRIGYLGISSPAGLAFVDAFRQGLHELVLQFPLSGSCGAVGVGGQCHGCRYLRVRE